MASLKQKVTLMNVLIYMQREDEQMKKWLIDEENERYIGRKS